MYSTKTGLVLAFHGTDAKRRDAIVASKGQMLKSDNLYDWLGTGFYFWESDQFRALDFAEEVKKRPHNSNHRIKTPAVLGAIIDLGYCLDLLDFRNLKFVKLAYDEFAKDNPDIPENEMVRGAEFPRRRFLDRAVIEYLHGMKEAEPADIRKPFDSVRAVFSEGSLLYDKAGFYSKSHIQICVRNPNCIKGFFHPRELDIAWSRV